MEIEDNENLSQEEEVKENDSDDNEAYNDISDGGWIQWFCQLDGNEFLVEIDEDFIRNKFNLFGITNMFKNYR